MRNVFLIGIIACTLGLAAEAPYAGKWKMNPAKSDFGETTMTYEQLPGGEIKATMDGVSYTFKADGKDVMTPWGMMMAWKSTGANSWEYTEKTNGKTSATGTVKLSADGKMLSMDSTRTKSDGGTSNESMSFERVSGGPGLAGKWKTKNLKSSSPETLTLTPKGADGLEIMMGNEGGKCDAKFDGKPHPAVGTLLPSGWTCVIAKSGESINITWQKDGKDMYKSTLTASGKTLTEMTAAPGTNEKVKIVYDKQ